jgi:hypothetical protein
MIDHIDLDHVAVATERQADAWPRYVGDLAGEWLGGGNGTGFSAAQIRYANGMKVEVLEPYGTDVNDFLRRFLDRNGPGPHHVTYHVVDLVAALADAEAAGFRPVGVDLSEPHWKEAFLHPKDAPGIVVQLAQSAGGDWEASPLANAPAPRTGAPATLVHVGHAVASLAEGMRLFRDLLRGDEVASGANEAIRWVDVEWPGAGRVRLMEPATPTSPMAGWLGGRSGRVHHIAFAALDPGSIPGAVALADGSWEVPPDDNLGTRLVLTDVSSAPRPG